MSEKSKKILIWLLDIGVNLVVIVILVFAIQKWIIAPFDVSGSSMCNTLNFINEECRGGYGEKIIINEAMYYLDEPKRGEIVVFKAPQENPEDEEKFFIKRVIGIPGDKIEIKDGEIYIQPKILSKTIKIEEPYLNDTNRHNTESKNFSTYEVPEAKYLLLGDNRVASTDGRSCFMDSSVSFECRKNPEKAFIDQKDIRGKAWVVWWPLKNIRKLEAATYPELEL